MDTTPRYFRLVNYNSTVSILTVTVSITTTTHSDHGNFSTASRWHPQKPRRGNHDVGSPQEHQSLVIGPDVQYYLSLSLLSAMGFAVGLSAATHAKGRKCPQVSVSSGVTAVSTSIASKEPHDPSHPERQSRNLALMIWKISWAPWWLPRDHHTFAPETEVEKLITQGCYTP